MKKKIAHNRHPFHPRRHGSVKIVLGVSRFGALTVVDVDEDDNFICECQCGAKVTRSQSELLVRKLQACFDCALDRTAEILEWKEHERAVHSRRAA